MRKFTFLAAAALLVCSAFANETGRALSLIPVVAPPLSETATSALLRAAEQGDSKAAFRLSCHFLQPASWNPGSAFHWAVKADSAGEPGGAMLSGICYYEGVGTAQDHNKAAASFERALRRGNTRVLNALSCMYAEGTGVQQDSRKALELARQALEAGIPHAVTNYALYYVEGNIVPRNLAQARGILNEYLKRHPEDGEVYYTLAAVMNEEAISAEDYAAIIRVLTKAATLGETRAYEPLALSYSRGISAGVDAELAVNCLQKAAGQGCRAAMVTLANAYYLGTGVKEDMKLAAHYLKAAADAGAPGALANLAALYYKGQGVPQNTGMAEQLCRESLVKDPEEALAYRNLAGILQEKAIDEAGKKEVESLMLRAAELGDIEAMLYLVQEYASAEGLLPVDGEAAAKWCRQAAETGHPRALEFMAALYESGIGVPQDFAKAAAYREKAAALESPSQD